MQVTYKCERCGIDKTIEIKVPKTCSKECRLFLLGERQKARKTARLANQNPMEEANQDVLPHSEEQMNVPPDVPSSVPQENAESTPEQANNPGSEGDSSNLGQGTPGKNPVESAPQPTENPGATEGQA